MDQRTDLQIERIRRYEEKLDACNAALRKLQQAADAFWNVQGTVEELTAYYSGAEWKEDFEREDEGGFPKELKRGVLSEDGIYSMLEENREWLTLLRRA